MRYDETRDIFWKSGDLTRSWYPIGYSDTNLAMKLAAKGLKCFYTPYAAGIHHESVSRQASIEDFENSWWLHRLVLKHRGADFATPPERIEGTSPPGQLNIEIIPEEGEGKQ